MSSASVFKLSDYPLTEKTCIFTVDKYKIMIQRIQTIYLLLTTLFSIFFLGGKILKFTDEAKNFIYIGLSGLKKFNEAGGTEQISMLLPLAVLLILIPVVSIITIFLFKNRKIQIKLAAGLIFLVGLLILAIAYYTYSFSRNYNAEIQFGINLILPVLMLICSCLAYRRIKKDEEIVKSYDRLR
jgi:hypothetical protein